MCGRCCKHWTININLNDVRRLEKKGYLLENFAQVKQNTLELKKQKNGWCIFLEKDNKCSLQKNHGYETKPLVCRSFPHGKFVCGVPKLSTKKSPPKKESYDRFFTIGKKKILSDSLIQLLNNLGSNEEIFTAYCNILFNILQQEKEILIKTIPFKKYPLKVSKRLGSVIKSLFYDDLISIWSRIGSTLFKKELSIKLPTDGVFRFQQSNPALPKKAIKEFLPYLKRCFEGEKSVKDYPIIMLSILYLLPPFTKKIAGNRKITAMHIAHAFSMLNGIFRFKPERSLNAKLLNKRIERYFKLKRDTLP